MQWYIKIRMHWNKLVHVHSRVDYTGLSTATCRSSARHRYGSLNVYPHPHPPETCSYRYGYLRVTRVWKPVRLHRHVLILSLSSCRPAPCHRRGLPVVVTHPICTLRAIARSGGGRCWLLSRGRGPRGPRPVLGAPRFHPTSRGSWR